MGDSTLACDVIFMPLFGGPPVCGGFTPLPVAASQRVVAVCASSTPSPAAAPDAALGAEERAVCARAGISERDFATGKARLARLLAGGR